METAVKVAAEQSSDLNMTLSIGGLTALNITSHAVRDMCLEAFYERWKDTFPSHGKWLGLKASSPFSGTTEHLQNRCGSCI